MGISLSFAVGLFAALSPSDTPSIFPREAPPPGPAIGSVSAVGDLDGDGKPDVIADGGAFVCVARGDGLGGFVVTAELATGTSVSDLELCDVDADGDLDLAYTADPVSFYVSKNSGAATFALPMPIPIGPSAVFPRFLESADFDADGLIDIVTAGNLVEVRLGDGSGGFDVAATHFLREPATDLEIGDFDGDGRFDLAVLSMEDDLLSLFRGQHGGGFAAKPLAFGFGEPSALAAVDSNGDGFDDLMIARRQDGVVGSYVGDGQFHFTPKGRLVTGFTPSCVAVGDFDGDGFFDVVAGGGEDGAIVWAALGDGTGSLGTPLARHEANAPTSLGLGDFDGDAKVDAVAGGAKNGGLTVLSAIGQSNPPVPIPPIEIPIQGPVLATFCSDLDLDGDPDVVVVRDGPGYADLADTYLGDGAGGLALQGTTSLFLVNPPLGEIADYDGDSLPDLVLSGMQQIFVYRGNGSGFGPLPLVVASTTGHVVLDAVQFGGDARLDLIGIGLSTIFRSVNTGQTGPVTASTSSLGALANWSSAAAGDVDGDGLAEALIAKGGKIHALTLFGGTPTKIAEIDSPITFDLRLRDLDGDGFGDLFGLRSLNGVVFQTVIHRGLGGANFTAPMLVGSGPGEVTAIFDLDLDGGLDLVRIPAASRIEIVRTTGDGFLRGVDRHHAPPITPLIAPSPRLGVGDLDGDGWADLIYATEAAGASQLTIVRNVSRPGGLAFAPVPVGAGCAGAGMVAPTLSLKSGPSGGAVKYSFTIGPVLPYSVGAWLLSPSIGAIPAPGACGNYLASPIVGVVGFATPGSIAGTATLAVEFDLHPGTAIPSFAAQAFIADPAAPGGIAATNALSVRSIP